MKRTGFIPYLLHTSCTRETRQTENEMKAAPSRILKCPPSSSEIYNLRFFIFSTDGRLNFEKAIFLEEYHER